jgi:dTDP-4-amino-4,6-dideoxygalactose transaminase
MTESITVPFVDLKKQYKDLAAELENVLIEACSSASYILGPQVEQFEQAFSRYVGTLHGVGVASGTDALKLSLQALGIGRGDEVLVPANTFIATALGAFDLGFKPVPVDIDPKTFLMDLSDAEKKVSNKTRAMIPVHLYGQVMDLDQLCDFGQQYKISVVEDACQAHGARWKDRGAGSAGITGCFSFFPSKNLGAFGDGGIITTNDEILAKRLQMIRNYGSTTKYLHEIRGSNSRLDAIQAAVLQVKLAHLDGWNRKRFAAACRYSDYFREVPGCRPPSYDPSQPDRHVFHLYVLECDRRDELMSYLNAKGIQCGVHYPVPLHLHKSFSDWGYKIGICPHAERLSERILSLPIFPEITTEQVDYVAAAIFKFYG